MWPSTVAIAVGQCACAGGRGGACGERTLFSSNGSAPSVPTCPPIRRQSRRQSAERVIAHRPINLHFSPPRNSQSGLASHQAFVAANHGRLLPRCPISAAVPAWRRSGSQEAERRGWGGAGPGRASLPLSGGRRGAERRPRGAAGSGRAGPGAMGEWWGGRGVARRLREGDERPGGIVGAGTGNGAWARRLRCEAGGEAWGGGHSPGSGSAGAGGAGGAIGSIGARRSSARPFRSSVPPCGSAWRAARGSQSRLSPAPWLRSVLR